MTEQAQASSAFAHFLRWESTTHDTIDFKKVYVDMAGDVLAGLVLSQIVYWFLPNRDGSSKGKIEHEGHIWIAKRAKDWFDECRLTEDQARRVIKILTERELIITEVWRFDGNPTTHIRINQAQFLERWNDVVKNGCGLKPKTDKKSKIPKVLAKNDVVVGSGLKPKSKFVKTQVEVGQNPEHTITETNTKTYSETKDNGSKIFTSPNGSVDAPTEREKLHNQLVEVIQKKHNFNQLAKCEKAIPHMIASHLIKRVAEIANESAEQPLKTKHFLSNYVKYWDEIPLPEDPVLSGTNLFKWWRTWFTGSRDPDKCGELQRDYNIWLSEDWYEIKQRLDEEILRTLPKELLDLAAQKSV